MSYVTLVDELPRPAPSSNPYPYPAPLPSNGYYMPQQPHNVPYQNPPFPQQPPAPMGFGSGPVSPPMSPHQVLQVAVKDATDTWYEKTTEWFDKMLQETKKTNYLLIILLSIVGLIFILLISLVARKA